MIERRVTPVPCRRSASARDRRYRALVEGIVLLVRVLLAAIGVALLRWAYAILDNIWNYNDSGTVAYVVYSLAPGLPGALCIYLALRGPHALRRR